MTIKNILGGIVLRIVPLCASQCYTSAEYIGELCPTTVAVSCPSWTNNPLYLRICSVFMITIRLTISLKIVCLYYEHQNLQVSGHSNQLHETPKNVTSINSENFAYIQHMRLLPRASFAKFDQNTKCI